MRPFLGFGLYNFTYQKKEFIMKIFDKKKFTASATGLIGYTKI
jgi:hypothetical protein